MFNVQQTIEDLAKAIEHMRDTKWIQGRNFDRWGGCCAWGGVLYACTDKDMTAQESIDRAANVGRAFYRATGTELTVYNDTPGRTKDQVVRTLETVLAGLRADPSILTARKDNAGA